MTGTIVPAPVDVVLLTRPGYSTGFATGHVCCTVLIRRLWEGGFWHLILLHVYNNQGFT